MSIAILRRRLRDRARVRRRATRSWLLRRKQRSAYNTLLKEWHTEDPNEFRNYFRMDKTTFMMLLEKVRPLIERQDTKLREAISAAEQLAVTLRFLATDFPFPAFYYHVLLFCKHHLIIPKQYSDWLISVKVYQSLKKNRMEFYSIKVGQSFWSKISLTVVTIKVFHQKLCQRKTWTKCLLSKFFYHLCQKIGGKNWREIL